MGRVGLISKDYLKQPSETIQHVLREGVVVLSGGCSCLVRQYTFRYFSSLSSACFSCHRMAQSFQGPSYLSAFNFAPYNTPAFAQLTVIQQWNESQGKISELSVQLLELEIYEGPEKGTHDYKKVVWEATHQRWWHKQAAAAIQHEMHKEDVLDHNKHKHQS